MTFRVKNFYILIGLQCWFAHSVFAVEDVPTFVPKKIVSGWSHTCLLSTEGRIKCWGPNKDGELGIGSTVDVGRVPGTMGANLKTVDLGKNVVVKDLCGGDGFSCALTTTGRVKCWGGNGYGQLGQEVGQIAVGSKPNEMGDNLPWTNLGSDFVATDVQCGGFSACAMNTKGQVKCWGNNDWLQLGRRLATGTNIGKSAGQMGDKLPYLPLPPLKSVSSGMYHSCAASTDAVYCWGENAAGQGGFESPDEIVELPANGKDARKVKLEDDGVRTTIHTVRSGYEHACADYSTGMPAKKKTKCWGLNDNGQLGIASTEHDIGRYTGTMRSKLPELQLDSTNFIQMETYGLFNCALKRNGTVQCWGANTIGQLGLGDTVNRGKKPDDLGGSLQHVDLGLPVLALSHGTISGHVCALFINHEIKCWGAGTGLGYEDNLNRGGKPSDMGDNLPFVRYK